MTQEKSRAFRGIWIPRELWLREDLSLLDKFLIAEIDSLDRDEGCNATDKYFADFFKVSHGHIRNTLSELRERGLIETKSYDGRRRLLRQVAFSSESRMTSDVTKTLHQTSQKDDIPLIRDNKDDIPLQPPAVEGVKISDPIFRSIKEFLFDLEGIPFPQRRPEDYGRMTDKTKSILASDPNATLEEVKRRAENYRKKWPRASLTANALAKHYPSLGDVTTPSTSTSDSIPHY